MHRSQIRRACARGENSWQRCTSAVLCELATQWFCDEGFHLANAEDVLEGLVRDLDKALEKMRMHS